MLTLSYVFWLAAILFVCVYNWRRRKLLKILHHFYSLPALPLIGSLYLFTGNSKERVMKALDWLQKCEFPLVVWFFHKPVVFIGTPDDMQTVLNATNDRDTLGMFENIFGNGIILAKGEEWRKHRRIMNPAFSAIMLQQYLIVFNEQSKILTKIIEPLANTDKTVNIWNYMANMNLDVITQNMAGYKLKLQENGSNEFSISSIASAHLESMRFTQPLLFPNLMYNAYLLLSGNGRIFKTLRKLPRQIIRDKIVEYKSNKRAQNEVEDVDRGPKTLVDLLLKVHDTDVDFTEEQMVTEMLNMIFAGSESTALTSSTLLLMFAMNQDVQEKAYQEIEAIFGDDNDRPTKMEDMNRLVYLEQCIKETLRLFPVVPLTLRKHSEDIVLNDKHTIPAGVHTGVAFHVLHQNEHLYANPKRWDPEHFSEDAVRRLGKYGFLAFGAGPRNCIGTTIALRYYQNLSKDSVAAEAMLAPVSKWSPLE
nr:cytochrome P450 3638B1 [Phenacoccus solenopsis]